MWHTTAERYPSSTGAFVLLRLRMQSIQFAMWFCDGLSPLMEGRSGDSQLPDSSGPLLPIGR